MYYESTFNRCKHNIRKTWQTILNEIISKSQKKEQLPTMFTHGQQQLTDHREIANQFNIFFANIGPIQSSSINYTGDKTFDAYLRAKKNSFEHKYVNESTIMTIITNLPNKYSCGFDGLSTTILKSIKGIIIKPLPLIINNIFDTGVFPANFKIAKIIPIFKKDDRTVFNNYRPISLLPIISKVVEKVISDQLNEFFVQHKLLFDHQYGFRSGHSTEHAALELTDRIITNIDNKKSPLNIFLDLSKAFDTLDHRILAGKK